MQTRLFATLALSLAACAAPAPKPVDTSPADTTTAIVPRTNGPAGDQAWDQAILDQLTRDARKLAVAEGCGDVGACRTAPIGVKACGGPQDYVVFCAVTTDTAALFRKLDELARAQRAFNERYQVGSTCEFRVAPDVALVGQGCRAVP